MNQDVKRQWVDALRSGKYKQGKDVLRSGKDEFCCLGVLCDIAVKNGVEMLVRHENDYWIYDNKIGALPLSVMEWAGSNEQEKKRPDFAVLERGVKTCLASLNDQGLSFNEIADLIDEQL